MYLQIEKKNTVVYGIKKFNSYLEMTLCHYKHRFVNVKEFQQWLPLVYRDEN